MSFLSRLSRAYRDGRLVSAVSQNLRPYKTAIAHVTPTPPVKGASLYLPPPPRRPNPDERILVERLLNAFKLMRSERDLPENRVYAPSAAWQQTLDRGFAQLHAAADTDDVDRLHRFLANFGMWPESLGFDGSELFAAARTGFRGPFLRRYLAHEVFGFSVSLWQQYHATESPDSLVEPNIGNQPGITFDGGSTVLDANAPYNDLVARMLRPLVEHIAKPCVADLGGGSGKTGAILLRDLPSWEYTDFDLPETLTVAGYYLTRRFPEATVQFYGEAEGPMTGKRHLRFRPAFRLRDDAAQFDLFINRVSLGEMRQRAAFQYVRDIEAHLPPGGWFFHANHDGPKSSYAESASEPGALARDYPLSSNMQQVMRYPELHHLVRQGTLDRKTDVVMYLYRRRGGS